MKRTYNHTDKFYMKQYDKYNQMTRSGNLFNNFKSFKMAYQRAEADGMKNITKNFVYETDFEISYDTYRAERDMMKKIGKRVPKSELLSMTTNEFAEKYSHEINVVYQSYLKQGKSSQEASDLISMYFFGSL